MRDTAANENNLSDSLRESETIEPSPFLNDSMAQKFESEPPIPAKSVKSPKKSSLPATKFKDKNPPDGENNATTQNLDQVMNQNQNLKHKKDQNQNQNSPTGQNATPQKPPKPSYYGHRERLRTRLLERGGNSLADYELLEMLLYGVNSRQDMKPLAKALLSRFKDFGKVMTASPSELKTVKGVGDSLVATLKLVEATAQRMARHQVLNKPIFTHWEFLLDYCQTVMAHNRIEQFRVIYLNRKFALMDEEILWTGTVDETPVYSREVMKRVMEIGASAIIMVHNHPSGDPEPSKQDIAMTLEMSKVLDLVGVKVHDHLIISSTGHFSFKNHGLL